MSLQKSFVTWKNHNLDIMVCLLKGNILHYLESFVYVKSF